MQILALKKIRDDLLREVKKEKSKDYKAGYFDGVLDLCNSAIKMVDGADSSTTSPSVPTTDVKATPSRRK